MKVEVLAVIEAPHFTAGIIMHDDVVVEAADIVNYMRKGKWSRKRVRAYCSAKGWHISVVQVTERR